MGFVASQQEPESGCSVVALCAFKRSFLSGEGVLVSALLSQTVKALPYAMLLLCRHPSLGASSS